MIRFEYRGFLVHCTDVREADLLLRNLAGVLSRFPENPWHPVLFQKFVKSLGAAQIQILKRLFRARVVRRKVSDLDLQIALGVSSNKQLAGVLSGISKQAAAVCIPARGVYQIENESAGGKHTKFYALAEEFFEVAKQHWLAPVESSAGRSTSGAA